MAADTLLMGADPKTPPKKRVMKMAAAFLLVAVPMLKRPRMKTAGSIEILRPYTSLMGAQIKGPNAKPVMVIFKCTPQGLRITYLGRRGKASRLSLLNLRLGTLKSLCLRVK